VNFTVTDETLNGGTLGKMAELRAKIASAREKAMSALEDVPDTLIGFLIFLVLLTIIGLGILMFLGWQMTS
jgi:hypothetical protein